MAVISATASVRGGGVGSSESNAKTWLAEIRSSSSGRGGAVVLGIGAIVLLKGKWKRPPRLLPLRWRGKGRLLPTCMGRPIWKIIEQVMTTEQVSIIQPLRYLLDAEYANGMCTYEQSIYHYLHNLVTFRHIFCPNVYTHDKTISCSLQMPSTTAEREWTWVANENTDLLSRFGYEHHTVL